MKKVIWGLMSFIFLGLQFVHAENSRWIEAYPAAGSVVVGGTLDIHISANVEKVQLEATRLKTGWNKVILAPDIPVRVQAVPASTEKPWRSGAGWPVTYTLTVPESWVPGLYDIRVHDTLDMTNYARFVIAVQPEENGSYSKVAVLTNETTNNAYTKWGGKNNYKGLLPDDKTRANVVSFDRPGVFEYKWIDWKFPAWADLIGMPIEYVTSLQLHFDATLLDNYDVLVLAGHSEYWSREMRLALENFLTRGGKLISLSGNTMWWAVRIIDGPNGLQMVSCKGAYNDPECPQGQAELYTGYWYLMGNPETRVMGASFKFGGYVDNSGFYMKEDGYGGYFSELSRHWIWAGTGVLDGDHIGAAAGIAGYEADSPPIIFGPKGLPKVDPAAKNLPAGITVLGTTPAAQYYTTTESQTRMEGFGAMIHFPYGENGGEVFNCGSVDCSEGLVSDPVWRKAILNVFARFGALEHTLTDYDLDSIDDAHDNCIDTYNPEQVDSFADGTGDVCDEHCH